jgi:hypothetical protein
LNSVDHQRQTVRIQSVNLAPARRSGSYTSDGTIMSKNHDSLRSRKDALVQLKAAQKMLSEGRAELADAQQKIERAQTLINHSADTLRRTWLGKHKHK